MATTTTFDLSLAIQQWREKLVQSPHFKAENVAELESHVRDSVVTLQSNGLSSEESFLIATRRVGSVENLEPEFGKVNRNPRAMIPHGLTLMMLSVGCFFLWGMLQLPRMMVGNTGLPLPAFTNLLINLKGFLVVPPVLAAVYFLFIWFRRTILRHSWVGFFATSVGILILLTIVTTVALLLPIIDRMNHLPAGILVR